MPTTASTKRPRRLRLLTATGLLALVAAAPLVATAAAAPAGGGGMKVVSRMQYADGGELATDGRYVYASQTDGKRGRNPAADHGGFRIIDSRSGKLMGSVRCGGSENDIAVVRPGLVALVASGHTCRPGGGPGVALYDVRNPRGPRLLATVDAVDNVHTIAMHPDGRHLYVSDGATNAGFNAVFQNPILDTLRPDRPVIAGVMPRTAAGCHDVGFLQRGDRTFAYCAAGVAGVYVWDATDPAAPREVGRLDSADIQFAHWARPSPDGSVLLINDEAIVDHECTGRGVAGSVHLADLSDADAPTLVGRISPPRGRTQRGGTAQDHDFPYGCTSHQFDLLPGTRVGVFSWYQGGVSAVDYSNPRAPKELAHHMPVNGAAVDAMWLDGKVWVNDMFLGLTALDVPALTKKAALRR